MKFIIENESAEELLNNINVFLTSDPIDDSGYKEMMDALETISEILQVLLEEGEI